MQKSNTPSAKASTIKGQYGCVSRCISGARYGTFPRTSRKHQREVVAMPKSMSRTRLAPSSPIVRSTFSSERSLCAMPCSCSMRTAEKTSTTTGCSVASRSRPGLAWTVHHVKRSPSVARLVTTYVRSSSRRTPRSSQTCGKLILFRWRSTARSSHGCSAASGLRAWNERGPVQTQWLGICLTATRTPSSSRRIMSTWPKLPTASSNFLTRVNLPSSHGFTELMSSPTTSSMTSLDSVVVEPELGLPLRPSLMMLLLRLVASDEG
mmetsp:Transcript_63974/g.164679  ORF Transcript_63974/g.164679 Transcript_63974/m.164679 type:complete len:265 (-) Transcript_63974:196-990(-)